MKIETNMPLYDIDTLDVVITKPVLQRFSKLHRI